MLVNKIKHLNKSILSPVVVRTFLSTTFPELSEFPKSIDSYEKLHKFSIENTEKFWSVVARRRLDWIHDFDKVTSGSFSDNDFHLKWFLNGKLNVSGIKDAFIISISK